MRYRRDRTQGATYFFTLVTLERVPWLASRDAVEQLRQAFRAEMVRRPFVVDAIVIMPDHLHAIWSLPQGEADYAIRWRNIKRAFTASIPPARRPVVFAAGSARGNRQFGSGDIENIVSATKKTSPAMSITSITTRSSTDTLYVPWIGHTAAYTDIFASPY